MYEAVSAELDEFTATPASVPRHLEDYADKLWQMRVKTERESADSDDDTGSYSPSRENFYDSYYTSESDPLRDSFLEYSTLKRPLEEVISPTSATATPTTPAKRARGRPYKEACVKITCLKPEDKMNTLSVDFNKLQEEELGVPRSELMGGLRSSSKLPLTWTAEDLRQYVLALFPRVRSFTYMKCNQGKTLDPLPDDLKPSDMRTLLGRSGLYIVPNGPLLPKGSTSSSVAKYTAEVHPGASSFSAPPTATPGSSTDTDLQANNAGKQYWVPVKVNGEHVVNGDREFRITLDVSSYSPSEITLKTKNNRVVVHARHGERADEYGIVEREFRRQYLLPKDVDPNEVTSSLSSNGILTLKAPKIDQDSGAERIIPIRFSVEDS
ncbi:CRYAB-like protein [Mya arenaria]|uniref:CRYAB-like protein n=1 Tax=Mya arenaria TaxID=6604 RepID=A0ABY7FBT2_MYAAR|nr:CRYAB-like protein [Mya arenaria]